MHSPRREGNQALEHTFSEVMYVTALACGSVSRDFTLLTWDFRPTTLGPTRHAAAVSLAVLAEENADAEGDAPPILDASHKTPLP